ncbi:MULTISPECIES: hypothetical protein [unclassified Caballeronia]|uniref:hypothetical protein n=1 Tax=unclassified Caballeronia TaxID=2646786 RepID=UPI001F38CDEF|nr:MULTISPECIES: hypothetical protein [unclassified Caballeronia]MCE4544515.1 hypothetical protein [Caballeronia sp. PC1]MCE4571667.1 hypothetical protein [Caballeronia sp. CLC5]
MIFHASMPANDPKHVAQVLAELWGGFAAPFSPFPGAWMAVAGDDRGSIIEVYPSDQVITPGGDREDSVSYGAGTFKRPQYSAFHMAMATKLGAAEVVAIGEREGWRAVHCTRGNDFFHVIELWIENSTMLEFLTPEMQAEYLAFATSENFKALAAAAAS